MLQYCNSRWEYILAETSPKPEDATNLIVCRQHYPFG